MLDQKLIRASNVTMRLPAALVMLPRLVMLMASARTVSRLA
jgi:hypothetical protein